MEAIHSILIKHTIAVNITHTCVPNRKLEMDEIPTSQQCLVSLLQIRFWIDSILCRSSKCGLCLPDHVQAACIVGMSVISSQVCHSWLARVLKTKCRCGWHRILWIQRFVHCAFCLDSDWFLDQVIDTFLRVLYVATLVVIVRVFRAHVSLLLVIAHDNVVV